MVPTVHLLVQGDDNMKYFQMMANGRHRNKRIFTLGQDEGRIEGDVPLRTLLLSTTKSFLDLHLKALLRSTSLLLMIYLKFKR